MSKKRSYKKRTSQVVSPEHQCYICKTDFSTEEQLQTHLLFHAHNEEVIQKSDFINLDQIKIKNKTRESSWDLHKKVWGATGRTAFASTFHLCAAFSELHP